MAQVGAEAKPQSEGYRERIRQAMMNDDVGQQRLRAAERVPDDPHLTPAEESQRGISERHSVSQPSTWASSASSWWTAR